MAEIALPLIVTAIVNSDLEGFVAGTLFSQGWNVIHRALDAQSLDRFLADHHEERENIILIYSPDLPGLSPDLIASHHGSLRQVIGFSQNPDDEKIYLGIHSTPHDPTELLNIVRSFVRAPLLRTTTIQSSRIKRARVIALGSPSGSPGCTTVAINLAMELSALGHETLLLDADVKRPSVAALLSQHKLDAELESRGISPHLSLSEFTQARVHQFPDYLDRFTEKFDFLIIDLGSIEGVSDSLTDRRWTSTLIHWSCERADELWILGRADVLGLYRMKMLVEDFTRISIRAKVSVILNMRVSGRRGEQRETHFLSSVASLQPQRIFSLPRDSRSTSKAEDERTTLIEIDERGMLRKSIARMAVEVAG
ncbi:MAG: P-loop NTPase [Actinobacteria bacterium]|nr:P-loop NTPase [Actinomycetota bacterium]